MSGQPLVSIIMIFLNGERFIEEAIASVFAQTWPHWELLLVDDGSSDRSPAIAKAWAERRPERVRYLQHADGANHGTGPSRNLGLDHARGEYIAFLDADDVFLPERLARHVAMLEARPEVGAVQSKMLIWHSWRGADVAEAPNFIAPALPFTPGSVVEPPGLLLLLLETAAGSSPGVCNVTVVNVSLPPSAASTTASAASMRTTRSSPNCTSKSGRSVGRMPRLVPAASRILHQGGAPKRHIASGRLRSGAPIHLRWLESYLVARSSGSARSGHIGAPCLAVAPSPIEPADHACAGVRRRGNPNGARDGAARVARIRHGRLLRWRGGQKKSRSQSRRERAVGRISRYVIDA